MKPTLKYEKNLWKQGARYIAGIDEVGRGALAGPVVVSTVIFPKTVLKSRTSSQSLDKYIARTVLKDVKDSKLLTSKKRGKLEKQIKKLAIDFAYGKAAVSEINRYGITKATHIAMRRAIKSLHKVDFILIDAFYIPYVRGLRRKKQLAIKKGDRQCFSIAAASILAKVHRDKLMVKLGKRYPAYGLFKNKGYGTLSHRRAIIKYGPKHFHRKTFIIKTLKGNS